ncbi:MAG: hypothetical protein FWH27_12370 [Planctomycetaceae bacterium]|nr:hypothetical protein [Planctomycetaceae bacterium]
MTGMTDISRHGGDKKHRDELDIKVKDDALVDPQLIGVTSSYLATTDNLVDDSDDDDGCEIGGSGPGMAANVAQTGVKLLFFPLILVSRGVMSLKHLPWLFGQIWHGVRNAPASLKHIGTVVRQLFSGRIGKVLVVIGTLTGIIRVSRNVAALGTSLSTKRKVKRLAAEEAALESQIRAEEATKPNATTVHVQPGGGHRRATATAQFAQPQSQSQQQPNTIAINRQQNPPQTESQSAPTEHEEPKLRKKLGFGQLSKLATAFKRSEPVTPHDAATPNEDGYDPFAATNSRWGAKKSMLFAAACLMLLVGCLTVARQVMQKSGGDDIAARTQEEGTDDSSNTDAKTLEPDLASPKSGPYPQNEIAGGSGSSGWFQQLTAASSSDNGTNMPGFPISTAPNMNAGALDGNDYIQSDKSSLRFQEMEQFSPPAMHSESDYGTPSVVANNMFGGQSTTMSVDVLDDPNVPAVDSNWGANNTDNSFAAVNPIVQPDAGEMGYGNEYATGIGTTYPMTDYGDQPELSAAPSPLAGNPGGFSLTTNNDLPVVPAQTVPATNTASAFALGGMNTSVPEAASVTPPESNQFALAATPRVTQDRGIPTQPAEQFAAVQPIAQTGVFDLTSAAAAPVSETAAPLAKILRNPRTPVANSNGNSMSLAAGGSATAGSSGMITNQDEPDGWETMSPAQPAPYEPPIAANSFQLQSATVPSVTTPQTVTQPLAEQNQWPLQAQSQTGGMFTLSSGEPSSQPAFQIANVEPVVAPVTPMVQPTVQPITMPTAQSQAVVANNTQATSPLSIAAQESIGGIVSPTQHIAAIPMVSTDTQANPTAQYTPPVVVNADTSPRYSAQTQTLQGVQSVPQQPGSQMAATQPVSNGQASVYIVQPGDNIYKIAKQELGNVRRYREIYDLNRDRIPIGQDTLTAGMELLLPTAL